jgi:hypothetical protein
MPEVLHLRAPAARKGSSPRRGRGLAGHLALMPGGDVAAFRAALAVVGLAVIDDAFVDPEPGVRADDHIVSGLVPLAVIVLLIAAANRMPSLLRGWLAIFTGALAITAGVTDGVRHILVDRLSGTRGMTGRPGLFGLDF